jgi:hypothetical protein
MKDLDISIMGENKVTIQVVQDLDLIFLKPPRGTKVEVPRVFIPKRAVMNFCPLTPVGSF